MIANILSPTIVNLLSMQLPERLKWAMEKANVNPADVARHLKITQASVTHWLSGSTKQISPRNLFKLAHFLGVEAEWLGTGDGPRTLAEKMVREDAGEYVSDAAAIVAAINRMSPENRSALRTLAESSSSEKQKQ